MYLSVSFGCFAGYRIGYTCPKCLFVKWMYVIPFSEVGITDEGSVGRFTCNLSLTVTHILPFAAFPLVVVMDEVSQFDDVEWHVGIAGSITPVAYHCFKQRRILVAGVYI